MFECHTLSSHGKNILRVKFLRGNSAWVTSERGLLSVVPSHRSPINLHALHCSSWDRLCPFPLHKSERVLYTPHWQLADSYSEILSASVHWCRLYHRSQITTEVKSWRKSPRNSNHHAGSQLKITWIAENLFKITLIEWTQQNFNLLTGTLELKGHISSRNYLFAKTSKLPFWICFQVSWFIDAWLRIPYPSVLPRGLHTVTVLLSLQSKARKALSFLKG